MYIYRKKLKYAQKMVGVMLGGWGQPEIVRKAKMGEMG
jgi:hypothetical protein